MKKVLLIALLILFGMVSILLIAQNIHSEESDLIMSDVQPTSIESEKKEFMLLSMTLEELSKTWPENKIRPYRNALIKFPDLSACLSIPNNTDYINWSTIKSLQELDVCLSHIHSYIGDVKQSEEWFKQQGFRVFTDSHVRGASPTQYHTIHANWITLTSGPLKNQKSPLSGPRVFFEELFAISGLSVGLTIDPEGRVIDVSSGFSRK